MKTIKRVALMLIGVLLLSVVAEAQSKTFTDVKRVRRGTTGPIIEDRVIVGYYNFFMSDKVDKKKRAYQLSILDQNLNDLGSKRIIDDKWVTLLESAYNGSALCMKFYNYKEKAVVHRIFNTKAEEINKKSRVLEKKWEIQTYSTAGSEAEITNESVFPVEKTGFVDLGITKDKKLGYSVSFIPEAKGVKGWRYRSRVNDEANETADYIGSNSEMVLLLVAKSKGRNQKKPEQYVVAIDTKTGKRLFEKKIGDSRFDVAPLNGYVSDDGSSIGILGNFYEKDANQNKAKSLGLFSVKMDKTGKLVKKTFANWEKELGKFVEVSAKGKIKDVGYLYFHQVVQTSDGNIYAIGESYQRQFDALGTLNKLNGGDAAATKIAIKDMAIMKFNSDFEIEDLQFFAKTHQDVNFGAGSSLSSAARLARSLKYNGFFDYLFTQRNKENTEFTVGYQDVERKNLKVKVVYGAISLADDQYSVNKVDLSKNSFFGIVAALTYVPIYPAKPGYIVLTKYNRKEKTYKLSLEKVLK